jgi:hypothetical protein
MPKSVIGNSGMSQSLNQGSSLIFLDTGKKTTKQASLIWIFIWKSERRYSLKLLELDVGMREFFLKNFFSCMSNIVVSNIKCSERGQRR